MRVRKGNLILNWVKRKFDFREEQKKRQDPSNGCPSYCQTDDPESHNKSSNSLASGLLTIGTLGNCEMHDKTPRGERSEDSPSAEDAPDFAVEELNKLQSVLTKILSRKSRETEKGLGENNNLPLDRFLNCPSSLEIERYACQRSCDDLGEEEGRMSPATMVIIDRMKEVLVENGNSIHQRSFAFLLKKMFICKGGFAPAPSLRDPLPPWSIGKILKSMLHQKIHGSNSTWASRRRFLDKRPVDECDSKDGVNGQADATSKWVKTDPEYIVLEI